MHTRSCTGLKVAAAIAAMAALHSHGQSADALIEKLLDKGILTVEEAKELREEADEGFNSAYQTRTGLPDWVTSLRIGGDVRGRYEGFYSDHPEFVDRNRFRYRLRVGAVATITDNFEVGFRLTSSERQGNFGGDPLSGNTTFSDNASKKWVFVDRAYAKWKALNTPPWSGSLTVGKMENPFGFSEMVFDPDYTPEGFAQQFAFAISDVHKLGLNAGQFVLDEIGGSSSDPYLLGAQLRLDSKWNQQISTALGIGGLMITSEERLHESPARSVRVQPVDAAGNPAGAPISVTASEARSAVPNSNTGNSRNAAGVLTQDYNPFIAQAEFAYTLENFWQYDAAFPIRLRGEYLNNPGADAGNEGYTLGITFGKAGKKGLWELGYRWKHLQADAWYEELVDSDFGALQPGGRYGAGTNVEGHIFKAAYSPYDSLTLGLTYFLAERIAGVTPDLDEKMARLQVDASWKF